MLTVGYVQNAEQNAFHVINESLKIDCLVIF